MSRYIDIEPYEKDGWYLQKCCHSYYGEAVKIIPLGSVPTAELNCCGYWDDESHFCALRRPQAESTKHGRWIRSNKSDYMWECSSCGWGLSDYRTTYCYDCGAKMEE